MDRASFLKQISLLSVGILSGGLGFVGANSTINKESGLFLNQDFLLSETLIIPPEVSPIVFQGCRFTLCKDFQGEYGLVIKSNKDIALLDNIFLSPDVTPKEFKFWVKISS